MYEHTETAAKLPITPPNEHEADSQYLMRYFGQKQPG